MLPHPPRESEGDTFSEFLLNFSVDISFSPFPLSGGNELKGSDIYDLSIMTAAVLFPSLMGMMMLGGTELVYGECHRVEQTAGIVLIGCYTFLIGNTILGCVDQILGRAHESNHREYSKTYKEISVSVLIAKASVHSDGNALGNIAAATASAPLIASLLLCVERQLARACSSVCERVL